MDRNFGLFGSDATSPQFVQITEEGGWIFKLFDLDSLIDERFEQTSLNPRCDPSDRESQ
jgi:hypothetical protein